MTATHESRLGPVLDEALLDPGGREPDAVSRTQQPFGRSRMLPAAAYTSDAVLAWERRHLFAGTWTCVGREGDLRADGANQRAVGVGDVSVLLTWGATADDGPDLLRAFANTCRHRGHELLPTDGAAESAGDQTARHSIVCPYHAWTYDLGGRLRAAPGFRDVEGFDRADHSLVALPVERWLGWVFVHALTPLEQGPPVSFADHVGALGDIFGPYEPQRLVEGERHTYEIAANWKVVAENYHECYHCPLIHPELCQVSPPSSGDNYHEAPGAWVGGSMDLRDGMETMSLTGRSGGRPIPGVDPTKVLYIQLWPNLLISAHPDYVMTHRLVPQAPNRTWIECTWYVVDPGDGSEPDASWAAEFWDLTNGQDWKACESVQRGLSSPHFQPGPFAPAEDAVHELVAMVGRGYQGLPLH